MLESIREGGLHPFGVLPARAALGSTMLYHGVQKLRDTEKAGGGFESIGIKPGKRWAIATGLAEAFAGASTLLGVLTRPAAVAVLVTQSVAIAKVHGKNGFEAAKGGYEFNLALMAIAADLLFAGPGRLSLHRRLDRGLAARRAPFTARRRRSGLLRIAAALLG